MTLRIFWLIGLFICGLLTGCGDSSDSSDKNHAPVANAGENQAVSTASLVTLDGSASNDVDNDPLSFLWSFIAVPAGSDAALLEATTVGPSFTPDVAGDYVVQLIVNDGNTDSVPDTLTVTATAPAAWQAVQNVAPRGFQFDLQANASGQAVLLWRQDEAEGSSIWARHYQESTDTWGAPVQIKEPGLDVEQPRVAVNAAGDAVAVWTQFEAGGIAIWASTYLEATATWSAAQPLGSASVWGAFRPQVAINDAGQAIVVWEQNSDGTRYNLWVRTYDSGNWGIAEAINEGIGDAVQGQVVLDEAGKGVIVWIQDPVNINSFTYRIFANIYDFSTGWEGPQMIDPFPVQAGVWDYASLEPKIGMDSAGNAVVIWINQDINLGQLNNIWAIHYDTAAGVWSGAQEIDGTNETSYMHQLAVDDDGHAVAVWRHSNADNSQMTIAAATYAAGTGWAAPDALATAGTNVSNPMVATDGVGNAVVLWHQYNGTSFDIQSSARWVPATEWSPAGQVSTANGTEIPGIVVFDSQKALAAWYSGGLWASSFR